MVLCLDSRYEGREGGPERTISVILKEPVCISHFRSVKISNRYLYMWQFDQWGHVGKY